MKNLLYLLCVVFIFSCSKNDDSFDLVDESSVTDRSNNASNPHAQVTICHSTSSLTNPWVTITINQNALSAHMAHGDHNPDVDLDGSTNENPCGIGDEDDCDDNDPNNYPGNEEVCDGQDNNCDGEIDENCSSSVFACGEWNPPSNATLIQYCGVGTVPNGASYLYWDDGSSYVQLIAMYCPDCCPPGPNITGYYVGCISFNAQTGVEIYTFTCEDAPASEAEYLAALAFFDDQGIPNSCSGSSAKQEGLITNFLDNNGLGKVFDR